MSAAAALSPAHARGPPLGIIARMRCYLLWHRACPPSLRAYDDRSRRRSSHSCLTALRWPPSTTDRLFPQRSHTCFCSVDLPEYQSKEEMGALLLEAVRNTGAGFGLR